MTTIDQEGGVLASSIFPNGWLGEAIDAHHDHYLQQRTLQVRLVALLRHYRASDDRIRAILRPSIHTEEYTSHNLSRNLAVISTEAGLSP